MTQVKRKPVSGATATEKKPKLITEFFAQVRQTEKSVLQPATNTNFIVGENTHQSTEIDPNNQNIDSQKTKDKNESFDTEENKKASNSIVDESINGVDVAETDLEVKITEMSTKSDISESKPRLDNESDNTYSEFCAKYGFDKAQWVAGLSEEEKQLLGLEIHTLHVTWLAFLHKELTKPYFLKLKRFLVAQKGKTVFPPADKVYSWSHYTPLPDVKCLVLGQDPYHNFNQAHGLAFLVLEPTRPPPSLLNIYKALSIDFPDFVAPDYKQLLKDGKPGGGNLTTWAKRGVLMLNACLTVEAHKANSHAKQGWEEFTEKVIETAICYARDENKLGFVIMAWGTPAQKRVAKFQMQLLKAPFLVLMSVHPSPLSASRGFFDLHVFAKCNAWLREQGKKPIDWGLIDGNHVT